MYLMKLASRRAIGSIAACALSAMAVALPGAAQAAEIGQVCNTNSAANVIFVPSGDYVLAAGAGFRIEGFFNEYYYGHGNGRDSGYILRSKINQSTCHF